MAGYVRQSAASIITTATVTASPLNAEFNALAATFNATTGHTHSGGTGDGPKLPITSMADIADMKVMGNVSGSLGAVGPVAILDEDNMASNSATSLVTQQSAKAYADLMLPLTGGTMSGDIDAGTNTVTGLGTPSAASDAATKTYVDTAISSLVASAPGALDTLNELAASLGDDDDFAGTMTTSLATKLPLAGGTMTGNIDLNGQFVTNLITPTQTHHATSKAYVDGILGSATDASDSADAAAVSAAAALVSEGNADDSDTYAQEWATKVEDSAVSVAAGGDASTTFSALHHAAKAAASAAGVGTEFADNVFRVNDNSDATKQIAIEASGITTGTTRTLTAQDKDGTIAVLEDVNKLRLYQHFMMGS